MPDRFLVLFNPEPDSLWPLFRTDDGGVRPAQPHVALADALDRLEAGARTGRLSLHVCERFTDGCTAVLIVGPFVFPSGKQGVAAAAELLADANEPRESIIARYETLSRAALEGTLTAVMHTHKDGARVAFTALVEEDETVRRIHYLARLPLTDYEIAQWNTPDTA